MDDDSPASYIHMVHLLIEECILLNMNREECMEALSKHGNIQPLITSTVWKELEKENKEFFEAYAKRKEEQRANTEIDTNQRTQSVISGSIDLKDHSHKTTYKSDNS